MAQTALPASPAPTSPAPPHPIPPATLASILHPPATIASPASPAYQVQITQFPNPYEGYSWHRAVLYDWQTLLAGCFAIAAAWWTVRGAREAARIQAEATIQAAKDSIAATEKAAQAEVAATLAATADQINAMRLTTADQIEAAHAAADKQVAAVREQIRADQARHEAMEYAKRANDAAVILQQYAVTDEILEQLGVEMSKLANLPNQANTRIDSPFEALNYGDALSLQTAAGLFGVDIARRLRALSNELGKRINSRAAVTAWEAMGLGHQFYTEIDEIRNRLKEFVALLNESFR